jgi:hypothetical protein
MKQRESWCRMYAVASLSAKGAGRTSAVSLLEHASFDVPKVTAASVVLRRVCHATQRNCGLWGWGACIKLRSAHVYGGCGTNDTLSKKNGQPDSLTMVLRRMTASPMLFILVLMDSGLLTVKRKYLSRLRRAARRGRRRCALTVYISSPLNPP